MLIQTLRITACFAVLAHAALPAQQMSGAYTIDPNRVGNRNFKSFTAASFQLGTRGVSGAVTLTAANGQYFESWFLGPIPGASAKNLVTFKSATPLGAKLGEVTPHFSVNSILHIFAYGVANPTRWVVLEALELSMT